MGQHEHHAAAPRTVTVAVVTLSDSRSPADDRTGDTIVALLEAAGHTVAGREFFKAATTWSQGTTGTHGGNAEFIIGGVDALLDEFLNEYLKTNQR